MNNSVFENISKNAVELLKSTSLNVEKEGLKNQLLKIKQESPYSTEITASFSNYDEFYHICELGLKEAFVTRKSLIREIDLDLFISCKGKTNFELMMEGASPYAADEPESCIVIHHIGQGYNSAFAELTEAEHSKFGNSKLLHSSKIESWRSDKEKINQFQLEKIEYWKKRASGEIVLSKEHHRKITASRSFTQKDIILNIREPLEAIFNECSVSDLRYIATLANNYILTKEIGVNSIEEFILTTTDNTEICCPHCSSKDFLYYSYQETNAERKQRYKCRNCNKVFSLFQNTIISGCNFSLAQWIRFIDCLYNGFSLKKTAQICEISIQAAANNRIKLFYALKLLNDTVKLSGDIVIDETYIHLSHKGNRSKTEYELIRPAHKRGRQTNKKGLSKDFVCVVCAMDDNGNSVAQIAGLGQPKAERIKFALDEHIDIKKTNTLYSDKSKAIKKYAEINSFKIHQASFSKKYSDRKPKQWSKNYIQQINSFHSRMKKFIRGFNGVSSELLFGYMYLFTWKERNLRTEASEAYKELLNIMLTPGLYKTTEQIIKEKIIMSAQDIEGLLIKPELSKKFLRRANKIYKRWGNGESMVAIAKDEGVSQQRIHKIIDILRKSGYAERTQRDILQEEKKYAMERWQDKLAEKHKEQFERNYGLLMEQQRWSGNESEFYQVMQKRYGIKTQTIKNRISEAKRTLLLTREFKISDTYEYCTLEEIFRKIQSRNQELRNEYPMYKSYQIIEMLSNEFNYNSAMIYRILQQLNNPKTTTEFTKKKIPRSQIVYRDISIFIDYMKWTGDRASFFSFVEKKYKIKRGTAYKILQMNYMADPQRYDITK